MTRERFTTGGGDPTNSETDELSDVLFRKIEYLQPLDGVLDNTLFVCLANCFNVLLLRAKVRRVGAE